QTARAAHASQRRAESRLESRRAARSLSTSRRLRGLSGVDRRAARARGHRQRADIVKEPCAMSDGLELAYLIVSCTTTAARAPEIVRGLLGIAPRVVTIATPNARQVIAPRELSVIEGNSVVESYFEEVILPRPPLGLLLVAPCSFNSLNKLAH